MAADNVRVFHQATRPEDTPFIETTPGVRSKLAWRPIASAGLYIPGGTAPLVATTLIRDTNQMASPAFLMMFAAVLALVSSLWVERYGGHVMPARA